MQNKDFFQSIYNTHTPGKTKEIYDEWSATYDKSVIEHGYATPERCAAALAEIVDEKSEPILDFGCGTGISGMAFRDSGFTAIDGCDLSNEMLAKAEERRVYRNLWQNELGTELQLPYGKYSHIAAVGVISVGAAPINVFEDLFEALPTGGSLTFSFNDHTLKDPTYIARVAEYTDTGAATVEFKEYGEHLPGLNMNSVVYVLAKN